jgi:SAM-dependent methyltransferase
VSGYATTGPLNARIAIHAYGTNPVSWYAFVRALLPPADLLLEAGAGTGALWADGAPPGLVATDLSAAMCDALRQRGLRTVRADAAALPFAGGTFGGAVCNHVLYHLDDPHRGLAELRRVVRDGGWVAVATNGTGHMAEVTATGAHEHFPAERLAAALGEHFADVTLHRYEDTLLVPSADPVVAYAESMGATVARDEVEAVVARDGAFRVTKNTVLALAR